MKKIRILSVVGAEFHEDGACFTELAKHAEFQQGKFVSVMIFEMFESVDTLGTKASS